MASPLIIEMEQPSCKRAKKANVSNKDGIILLQEVHQRHFKLNFTKEENSMVRSCQSSEFRSQQWQVSGSKVTDAIFTPFFFYIMISSERRYGIKHKTA